MTTCYRCKRTFPPERAELVAVGDPDLPPYDEEPFCPECFRWFESDESKVKMITCPRCSYPLRVIPGGRACDACQWGWVTVDAQPVTARAEDVDVLTDGNAIRTPYGMCTPWNGGRAR